MTSTEGIGWRPLVKLAVAALLLMGVSVVVGDAVIDTRSVNVGETEVVKPLIAVALLPGSRGVVAGTTTSSKLDVRKQTSNLS